MNNDNDLNLNSLTKLLRWLRYCLASVVELGFVEGWRPLMGSIKLKTIKGV